MKALPCLCTEARTLGRGAFGEVGRDFLPCRDVVEIPALNSNAFDLREGEAVKYFQTNRGCSYAEIES